MEDAQNRLEAENKRLKIAVKELATLNEISSVINSAMPVEEISQVIMKKVVTALQAGESAIFTFMENSADLTPHTFVRGKLDSSAAVRTRLDVRIAGWIAKNKRPLVIKDTATDPVFSFLAAGENPVKSLLAVPLTAKGNLLGALAVFNSLKPNGFADDDVRLLSIIGAQSAQIMENARLYQKELLLKQFEGELAAAKKIQEGFLPEKIPAFQRYDIFGTSFPAKEVGGDFYDFIKPADHCLYFSIGDVTGKGLPAALLMSTIQGQVRLMVNRDPSCNPAVILADLNPTVCQMAGSGRFASMIIGRIDNTQDRIVLSNAGHCLPLIARNDGRVDEIPESSILVGVIDLAQFEPAACTLNAGEFMVLASDGIDEAFDVDDNQFGIDRLKEAMLKSPRGTAQEIHDFILQALFAFRGQADQSDDITLVVIKKSS